MRELIAGEAENDEALRSQLFVKFLQIFVLRCETAFARGVNDEHRLACKVGQRHIRAVVVGEGQVIEGRVSGHPPIVSCPGSAAKFARSIAEPERVTQGPRSGAAPVALPPRRCLPSVVLRGK